uniref:SEC24 homolog B, COPII coat complex component n=1 Tax=Astyanax mexicanus TaxID=7994 RepID=A0A8B9KDU8_ASTMX
AGGGVGSGRDRAGCDNYPTHPAMYPASSYYSGLPQQGYPSGPAQGLPAPGKAPLMNADYSGNYYHKTHSQPGAPPGPYPPPPTSQTPTQPPSTTNPPVSGAPQYLPQSYQQPVPYSMSANYYGQHYSATSQGQPQQQPNLVPASSGTTLGTPLYPIVSYPSAPGSSQYGTLRSSQAPAGPPPIPNMMPPPTQNQQQHQYPHGNGPTPTPTQQGYGAPPLHQTATVNGQSNAGQQHYDQTPPAPVGPQYGSAAPSPGALDGGSRPPSGAPSAHSSPGHQQGEHKPSATPDRAPASLLYSSFLIHLPFNLTLNLFFLIISTFRCTLSCIPQTQALLNKARLPLGLLLHPFRDLTQLPVITSNTIVRCRSCRTYINPFVSFLDQRRWKCNLCYRVNDVPDEFMYNPVTRSYGEPHKRPEVQNSTVEFIASSDYMVSLEPLTIIIHYIYNFYKKLALDCSGQQIGVDLFLLSSQYADMASLACMSKYSAGSVFYYQAFHHLHNQAQKVKLQKDLQRYLTRKIGFEAVMRIRCTKGLSIHTFHGNFFVRSTDLLSLANVNPDSGFAVQMSIDESLADTSLACFQAALLYTSSKGKRRIRVHTLCLPVVSQLSDVFAGADVQAITCLLANMAIDRSISSSLSDARDALVNAVVDSLEAFRSNGSNLQPAGLIAPAALRLFPLYVLALLKQKALRTGVSTRLDERLFSMCEFKSQPLRQVMRMVHPDLYRIDNLTEQGALHLNERVVPQPPLLQLTAEKLSREGAFVMDCGSVLFLWVGKCCNKVFIRDVLGCPNYASIPPNMTEIPELETAASERSRAFVSWLQESRAFPAAFYILKDDPSSKSNFFQHLVEDRSESAFSYYEFLLHVQQQMSK